MWLLIFISIFVLTNATPSDLSCKGITKGYNYDMEDCRVINDKVIQCNTYLKDAQNTTHLEVETKYVLTLNGNVSLSTNEKFDWCLNVQEIKINLIDKIPLQANNVFRLSSDIFGDFTNMLSEASMTINFRTDATVGLLRLQPDCIHLKTALQENCISRLLVTSFIIAPEMGKDFTFDDFQQNKIKWFYFNQLNGHIENVKIKLLEGSDLIRFLNHFYDTKVVYLDASDNHIHGSLTAKSLGKLSHLQHLKLNNCSITKIDQDNFIEMPNLKILDLSHNELNEIPKGIKELEKLEELNLSYQRKDNAFDHNFNVLNDLNLLKILNLSYINLHGGLLSSSFQNLNNLQILDLSYAEIQKLPTDVFYNLNNLKQLNLSGNKLGNLKADIFNKINFSPEGIVIDLRETNNTERMMIKDAKLLYDNSAFSFIILNELLILMIIILYFS